MEKESEIQRESLKLLNAGSTSTLVADPGGELENFKALVVYQAIGAEAVEEVRKKKEILVEKENDVEIDSLLFPVVGSSSASVAEDGGELQNSEALLENQGNRAEAMVEELRKKKAELTENDVERESLKFPTAGLSSTSVAENGCQHQNSKALVEDQAIGAENTKDMRHLLSKIQNGQGTIMNTDEVYTENSETDIPARNNPHRQEENPKICFLHEEESNTTVEGKNVILYDQNLQKVDPEGPLGQISNNNIAKGIHQTS
ncbi:hypothetical protein R1flu_029123 [Riccia fluitans]|uniref:Uncharacterized protein n=1 Tax=Riccia fluitans TaxID=41844 RepID=A0ABD1XNM3_9MARC